MSGLTFLFGTLGSSGPEVGSGEGGVGVQGVVGIQGVGGGGGPGCGRGGWSLEDGGSRVCGSGGNWVPGVGVVGFWG